MGAEKTKDLRTIGEVFGLKDRGVFVIFVVLILLVAALIIKSILPSSFFAETNSHEDKTVLRLSGYGGYL